ncbi:MAG: SusC/RagA family TonB-linked outer membrane protein, partial [Cruoricaptor ignavus]|nr:SusC/RagA family TonB-linked outer membrane protein [Cruoricaptor ignavus]
KNDVQSYERYFGTWADIGQYRGYQGTDYLDEIYGNTGTVYSNDINVRGGDSKLSYSLNLANYLENGIMLRSDFRRDNLSLNIKNKASNKIDLGLTFRYSNTVIGGSGANEQQEYSSSDARLRHSIGYSPIYLPGLTTDDTDEAVAGYLVNPFIAVADNDRSRERRNYNILGTFSWKLNKYLTFRSDNGFDYYRYLDSRFYGRSTFYVQNIPLAENQRLPALIFGQREDKRFRTANTLSFDSRSLLGNNQKLRVLLGQEFINTQQNNLTNTLHGFPEFFTFDNAQRLTNLGKPQSVNNIYYPDDRLLSFFGRVNYDLFNKYLVTATLRADGSSKFLGDNRWGYFPSVAVAWKMNEEAFLRDVSWINMLKMRISYGQAGNNNIPTGQTARLFYASTNQWLNGVSNFLSPSSILYNPDLKWETTITQNLGLDYDFFRGRISGSVEVYKNIAKDLLILFPIEGSGYLSQYRNMGETQNKGIEASLNVAAIRKDDYNLNLSFNLGINRNRVNSLGEMDSFGIASNWASTAIGQDFLVQVGQPVGMIYGYRNAGRYEVSDFDYNATTGTYTLKDGVVNASTVVGAIQPGTMKLKDLNGDGVVDVNDRTIIGNTNPKHVGGFVLNANIKNFDLMAAFNWSYGNNVYNASKIEHTTVTPSAPNGQYRNLQTIMQSGSRWTNLDMNTGTLVTDPDALSAMNANTNMWSPAMARFVLTDWAVEDGSFLRLNTLTLGYSLPEDLVNKLKLTKIRIYATANNVFLWTKYSGLDPEVNTRRATPLTPGVDYSPYPRSRQYIMGINLSF